MKKNIFLPFLILSWLFLISCNGTDTIVPVGNVTTQEHHFENFNELNVSHAFNVTVNFSDTEEKIEIEANENLHAFIQVDKKGKKLVIKIDDDYRIQGNATLNATIITRNIKEFEASGASIITLNDPLEEDEVEISLSGASSFSGTLIATKVETHLSGSSEVDISGSAASYFIRSSGASTHKHYDFETDNLDAHLSGASSVYVTVNEEISVDASGASTVYYKGDASIVHQNLSGSSRIVKED